MKKAIKNIFKRAVTFLAAATMGITTLAAEIPANAAVSSTYVTYVWDANTQPRSVSQLNGGPYGRLPDTQGKNWGAGYNVHGNGSSQIIRFTAWNNGVAKTVFCIEPGVQLYSGVNLNVLSDEELDTYRSWVGGNWSAYDEPFRNLIGMVTYYGYASHTNDGNYRAATQLLIWEMVLGYRGRTKDTFNYSYYFLYNNYYFPYNSYCSYEGTKNAYWDIVNNVVNHRSAPSGLYSDSELAKLYSYKMTYNATLNRYETQITVPASITNTNNLRSYPSITNKLTKLMQDNFSGTFGTDYGYNTVNDGTNITYTVWSKKNDIANKTVVSDAIPLETNPYISIEEMLCYAPGQQNLIYSTRIDPVSMYLALSSSEYPDLTVTKSYKDLNGNSITATSTTPVGKLLSDTKFVVYKYDGNTKQYVQASAVSAQNASKFTGFTTSVSGATVFTANQADYSNGFFTIQDLPVEQNNGVWYYVEETETPSDAFEKLTASVYLPSLSENKNARLNMVNTERSSAYTNISMQKNLDNPQYKTDEDLANAYKETKFAIGYRKDGKVYYITKLYTDPNDAISAADKAKLVGEGKTAIENAPVFTTGSGKYYLPIVVNDQGKIDIDPDCLSTSILMQNGIQVEPGYLYDEANIDSFGKLFVDFIPDGEKGNFVFVEMEHATGMGYYFPNHPRSYGIYDTTWLNEFPTSHGTGITMPTDIITEFLFHRHPYVWADYARPELYNKVLRYKLTLHKNNEKSEPVSGAEFALYEGKPEDVNIETDIPLATAVTDSNGKCIFDYDMYFFTDYTYVETKAPRGYVRDTEKHHIYNTELEVDYGELRNDTFSDRVIEEPERDIVEQTHTIDIELLKLDSLNNIALNGIRFDLYCNGTFVETKTTGTDGKVNFTDLPLGIYDPDTDTFENKYSVKEVDSGIYRMVDIEGNVIDEYELVINGSMIKDDETQKINYSTTILNQPVVVDLLVHKTDDQNKPVKGVKFDVIAKEDVVFRGVKIQSAGDVIGTIETDGNGYASSTIKVEVEGHEGEMQLPILAEYEYELVETYTPKGYKPLAESVSFIGRDSGNDTLVIHVDKDVVNETQKGHVKAYKYQRVSDNELVPLAGAEFSLTAADKVIIGGTEYAAGEVITTLTTGADGTAQTADILPVGHTYYLNETKAPAGYVRLTEPVAVILEADDTALFASAEGYVYNMPIPVFVSKTDITTGELIEGATLQILDGDTVIEEWVTTKEQYQLKKVLEKGKTYKLHEKYAADGYIIANDVEFTVNKDDGTINKVEMKDDYTKVEIEKVDADSNTIIAGAEMQILDGTKVVEEWTSTTSAHVINAKLVAGKTYTLHEAKAPAGYNIAKDTAFTVSTDGSIDKITFKNKKTETQVTKKAITGEDELPGATLIVYDGGEIKDKWVSGTKAHSIFGLEKGKIYTLHEETAPNGYAIASDVEFMIKEDGSVTVVTMRDDTIDIDFYKLDEEGNNLEGATLKIVDQYGTVVKTWTSTDKPLKSHAELIGGLTYTMEETEAPKGYNLSGKVTFTVPYDGSLTEVKMVDKPTVVEFSKKGLTGEDEVAGAQMAVYDENGSEILKWTSTDKPYIAKAKLEAGKTYTIKELVAPTGYVKAADQDFTVSTDGSTDLVVVRDDTTKVEFKKLDDKGNNVVGAELKIVDQDGNIVKTFKSTAEPYRLDGVLTEELTYTLEETKAPKGYNLSGKVSFKVSGDGSLDTVTMVDKPTVVEISKKSLTGEDEVAGAQMVLYDENGNIVDEWTSTDKPHVLTAVLEAGKKYTLHEKAAPKGFAYAEDIDLTVSTDGSTDLVVMRDDITRVEVKKLNSDGDYVEGATLQIIDPEGNVLDEWVTVKDKYIIEGELEAGIQYKLHEKEEAKGYTLAADIPFTVSLNGEWDYVVMSEKETYVTFSKKSLTGEDEIPGAYLKVIDEAGRIVDEWTSTDKPHIVKALLEAGKNYILHEEVAPTGYVLAEDYDFTVSTDGSVDVVTMRDDTTKVHIAKYDAGTNTIIAGATLQILDGDEIIDEWVSETTEHYVEAVLVAGKTYTLHEVKPPKGYISAADVEFTVSTDGRIDKISMLDYATDIHISKKTITGDDELPGAAMILYDENHEVIEQWVSTTEPHVFRAVLEAGKSYTLHEEIAPDGYVLAADIPFTVEETGEVQTVVMRDDTTKVEIAKYDADKGTILAGATMQILDGEDIIEEWVSTDTPHQIIAKLIAGKTYTLHEAAAPDNYELTADVTFTVSSDGQIDQIVMQDSQQKGNVEVTKKTEGSVNIANIKFILEGTSDLGNDVRIEAITNENGVALFENIPVGTYTVTEDSDSVIAAYLVAEPQEVSVYYTETSKLEFVNTEKEGSIQISKKTEGQLNLEGITFILSGISDTGRDILLEAVTDENGVANFTNIPVGTYTITESDETVPTAYLVAEPTEVEVFYNETTTKEIFNDEKKGTIKVTKDSEGKLNIKGIKFILEGTSDSGREIKLEGTTDEKGVVTFENIPIGTYTVTEDEKTAPKAYIIAEKQEVTVVYAKTSNYTFFNDEQKGAVEVTKTTKDNKNIEGITFVLSGTSDTGRKIEIKAKTDKDGKAVFENVPTGTYTVTEDGSTVPTAYLVAEPKSVTVTYAKTTKLTVDNTEKEGMIEVHKRAEFDGQVSGIRFILEGKSDSGRDIRIEAVTDANGIAKFEKVPIGTYTVTEDGSTVPSAYLTADPQSVTVDYAKTTVANFENKLKPTYPTGDNPHTGETNAPLAGLAIAGLVMVLFVRKKKSKKD